MIIQKIFQEAQIIIADESKRNRSEDLFRQYEIIRTRKWDKITEEPGILNNLVIQACSYSVVRKYFQVLYPEDIHRFDLHYSTRFFKKDSAPSYLYGDWVNIVLTWGKYLLSKEGLREQQTLDGLVGELKHAKQNTWNSYTKQPESRIVLSLATALPKVKMEVLSDPLAFLLRYDRISMDHPGRAFDLATRFSEGIIEMGNPLVCNFFKELGLLYYVKIDVHVGDFVSSIAFCKQFNKKEQFILSWLLAKEAGMEPFFLDKILYVGGKYAKQKMMGLFNQYREQYVSAVNHIVSQLPKYM